VLFNYRYNPAHWKVEELVASGKIGNVKSVHFEWLLVGAGMGMCPRSRLERRARSETTYSVSDHPVGHRARRRLLPPMAQVQGPFGRSHGPQVVAPREWASLVDTLARR
jgi:hypothetical protein